MTKLKIKFPRGLLRAGRALSLVFPTPRHSMAPPRLETLEGRVLQTVMALSANASPAILRPINPENQPHAVQVAIIRPVTLAGHVTVPVGVKPVVSFRVIDEYGRDQPSGTFSDQFVNPQSDPGQFFFTKRIGLNLTRRPGDFNGRQYTVMITAQDPQSTQTILIPVRTLVPGHAR
jgi:hypothetical protein